MSLEVHVQDLGFLPYGDAWRIQQQTLEARKLGKLPDTLLLVEHPPTISLGKNKEWNKVHLTSETLAENGITLVNSERGGGAAYLGPSQLIGYVIANIMPYGGVLQFMKKLEEIMIRSSKKLGISVDRQDTMNPTTEKPYRATWYIKEGKPYALCTKGIGLESYQGTWFSHHGFCVNVEKDHSYFDIINPCGFPPDQVRPISFEEILGYKVEREKVKNIIAEQFREVFGEVKMYASA